MIGDVTTTMLWIGGQITPLNIMRAVFLPSLVNLLVPLAFISLSLRGKTIAAPPQRRTDCSPIDRFERNLMFYLGLGVLIAVPAFKTVTHLPPFMGILLGLGIVWLVGEIVHRDKDEHVRRPLTLAHALTRIDMGSIVFFVGILLAVACLEHAGLLTMLARWLEATIGRQDVIVVVLGLLSAIIDNVPLVAATMGMYDLGALSARQLPLGVHRLLRRHRRLDPDHRLGRRRRRHGARADRVLLVRAPHRRARACGLSGGRGGLRRAACVRCTEPAHAGFKINARLT